MTPWDLAKSGSEHAEQRALFAWCNMASIYGHYVAADPNSYTVKFYADKLMDEGGFYRQPIQQLKWLHAIKNQGHGDAIHGAKAKAEGVKAGVWDIFLPYPQFEGMNNTWPYNCCGLYIEMKKKGNNLTDKQIEFKADNIARYDFAVCYSWQEARDAILNYLGLS
jgi:hypothetical protein